MTIKSKIAFVSCGPGSRPHYGSMIPIFPRDVTIDFKGLELYGDSLYEIEGKKDLIVRKIKDLVQDHRWDGIMVTAGASGGTEPWPPERP